MPMSCGICAQCESNELENTQNEAAKVTGATKLVSLSLVILSYWKQVGKHWNQDGKSISLVYFINAK